MVSEKAKKLILDYEGLNQPWKWPGGSSGITIGIGYDLGYEGGDFADDWSQYLSNEQIERLSKAIGVTGEAAREMASQFRDINVNRADSEEVFESKTLPKYEGMTRHAFSGVDNLPDDAKGALVSVVFNRGTSMKGDSRLEMRNIRDILVSLYAGGGTPNERGLNLALRDIENEIRSMKRIWVGKGLDGLLKRRDKEADLVKSCITVDENRVDEDISTVSEANSSNRVSEIFSKIKSVFDKVRS